MLTVAIYRLREHTGFVLISIFRFCTAFFPIKFLPTIGKSYFQGFYLIYGGLSLVKNPRWNKCLAPLFILAIYSILQGIYTSIFSHHYIGLLRGFQFLLLLYMTQAIALTLSDKDWSKLFSFWALAGIALYLVELAFVPPIGGRSFLFIERYYLLVGEPNFSAFFFASLTAVSLVLKKYKWIPLWIIFASLTFSRTPLLFYVTCIILLSLLHFLGPRIKWIAIIIIFGVLAQPFLFYLIYKFSSPEHLKMLEGITTRFYLQPLYFQMFLDHPLGVGLSRGHDFFEYYRNIAEPYLYNVVGLVRVDSNEQHSIYVQLLSETGIVGFTCFATFLIRFFLKTFEHSKEAAIVFVSFLPMMMVLNTMNEIGFYFLLSVILSRNQNLTSHFL